MARPVFVPVFEETENAIRERMLGRVSEEWRKEPGDFIHDAIAPSALEVQINEIQLDFVLKNAFPQYAEGQYLDYLLTEVNLTRIPAAPNKRALTVTADAGVTIPKGHTALSVLVDDDGTPFEFTVDTAVVYTAAGSQTVNLTCKTAGTATNLPTCTEFILQPSIPGVRLIVDTGTTTPGADQESDMEAWERYDYAIKHPATGGNKYDYVRWAGEVPGVGKAKCVPRWDGNNTVKVVLVGTDNQPATTEVVADVQEYLDPDSEGLGNGKAPCGSSVTVIAASNVVINVAATITWAVGADAVAAKAAFEKTAADYLKGLIFAAEPDVIYNKIGALLSFTAGVANYSGLTLNGATGDVAVGAEAIATLGTVTFT